MSTLFLVFKKQFCRVGMIALSIFFILPIHSIHAAPPPLPDEIQKTITIFFNLLKENKMDQAYEIVLANTKIKGREDEVKSLKKQTTEALTTYGPILSFEVIEQKRVGMSLLQIVCLSCSENFPLRWRFTYYRPGDKWKLLDIFVDDKIAELFDSHSSEKNPPARP
jgi:hypothetical protein